MIEKKKYGLPVAAILFAVSLTLTLIYYLAIGAEEGNYARVYYLFQHPNHVMAILISLLFIKRRDTMLLGVIGACTLGYLGDFASSLFMYNFYMLRYDEGWTVDYTCTLIKFMAYIALFLIALVLCEPTFIKNITAKLRQVASWLFFVPAALLTISLMITWIDNAEYIAYQPSVLLWLAAETVTMVAVLLLGKWLAYPKVTTILVNPAMERCKKELTLLKKTLDMGIISQEEYGAKKRQLLAKAGVENTAENI
jgi:hypothetical protein